MRNFSNCLRPSWTLVVLVLAWPCGWAAAQRSPIVREAAAPTDKIDATTEIDPDAGTESPMEGDLDEPDGSIAGGEECESIGGFASPSTAAERFRGNLYAITDLGVSLREVRMRLGFEGTADLYVSVHRRLADGSYEQVDINTSSATLKHIVLVDVVGTGVGSPVFYSSGILGGGAGIELTPGQYAIGFSWGPEQVRYGRDALIYPRPFEVGSVLASVARELTSASEPPMPDTLAGLQAFTGGVYQQQLCFVPVEGACCLSNGIESECVNVLEAQCVGEASFFHGQRTSCKDTICEFGACCYDCDTAINGFVAQCGDYFTQASCDATGGIAFWSGVNCPADEAALCPKLEGACCNGTTCSIKCEDECLAGGGTYEGDGTDCDPNTHVCKGACCVTGGCLDRTQAGCASSNGIFKGRGTRCFNQTCGGACCYGFTQQLEFCDVYADRGLCVYEGDKGFPFIAYRGDGTQCEDNEGNSLCGSMLLYKGCCLPDGSCMNTTQAFCQASWIQGTPLTVTCDAAAPNQCSNLQARCCYDDGSCEIIPGNACFSRGGTSVLGQTTCPAGACDSLAGACCGTAAGACTMKTASQCNAEGGFYQGDDSDCASPTATCPGFGACCRGNSECINNMTQAQCTAVGGVYRGTATTCAQVACDQRGACCAVTGTCLFTTVTTCAGLGGQFIGAGESCVPGLCPSGACCLPEGCKKRTPLACKAEGGDYLGDNVACTATSCIVQGGCCRGEVCTVEEPATCTDEGAIYLGNGTTCVENACVTGACCLIDGSCEEGVEQGACVGPGEVFHTGEACTVQCEPQGACCDGNSCEVTNIGQCLGTYQGDGVPCGIDTCEPEGACCVGIDCSLRTAFACLSSGGQYQGNDTLCGAGTCSGTPTGACCDDTACSDVTQAQCTGDYLGDGSTCAGNPCQASTCTTLVSDPAECAIDARRTHSPASPGTPEGWNSVVLTFDCDTSNHTMGDYSVAAFATGTPPAAPTVTQIAPSGNSITLTLSGPIPSGAWTCITYVPAGLQTCLGFLPGDVSADRATTPSDILKLIDHLNNIVVPPLPQSQCDIDRSNACLAPDIITLIDLLNGSNTFQVWNQRNLPVCP